MPTKIFQVSVPGLRRGACCGSAKEYDPHMFSFARWDEMIDSGVPRCHTTLAAANYVRHQRHLRAIQSDVTPDYVRVHITEAEIAGERQDFRSGPDTPESLSLSPTSLMKLLTS